jgi:hypothetical protein
MKLDEKKTRPEASLPDIDETPFFRLRALIEFNQKHNVFAAYCLETGNVVTADSSEEAKEMIKELLEDELCFAIEHNNLRNLYSSPAPMEIWKRWHRAARENGVTTEPLNISAQEIRVNESESEYNEVTLVETKTAA